MEFNKSKEILAAKKGKIKILVGNNKENLKIIKKNLINYQHFLKKSNNQNNYIGLDFEFNPKSHTSKKIALAQLYLEGYPDINNELGLVFDPTDEIIEDEFRNTLLTDNIKVILHGGESLDIPYLFNELFKNKKEIVKFTSNLIDTKYLCEYDLLINPIEGYRCKIYYLLLQKKVITEKKFNDLIQNEKDMGKIYKIIINVENLSDNLLKYSIYDVIFLPQLIRNLKFESNKDLQIVNTLSQLNFLWKNNLIPSINSQKETIEKIFNSYNKNNIRINEIFNIIINQIDDIIINYKKINFIKKFIEQIQKIYILPLIMNFDTFYYSNNILVLDKINEIDLPTNIKNLMETQVKIFEKITHP